MNTLLRSFIFALYIAVTLVSLSGCKEGNKHLRFAMQTAGDNRSELKAVLNYYKNQDCNLEKYAAARFLIENMPGHYSYKTDSIQSYYNIALNLFNSDLSIDQQRDSLIILSHIRFNRVTMLTTNDCKIMKSDYLINNIDHAYYQWKNMPWSKHLSFEDFCEWILPYKEVEKQEFDNWRELFSSTFSDSISKFNYLDDKESTIYYTIDVVRDEINNHKVIPHIYWAGTNGLPFLSANTMIHMNYGSCSDYVALGVLAFRSLGLPAVVDNVPEWGRNSNGHSWYVFLDDHGNEQATTNSLILPAGISFYPYERIPKVWRNTYALDWDVVEYHMKSKYNYSFDATRKDVTDHYNRTQDLVIPINHWIDKNREKIEIVEKYAYIAMFNGQYTDWQLLDFGKIKRGKAYFKNMGRDMLYIALGYDGKSLKPISQPFILDKSGIVRYIDDSVAPFMDSITLFRKYYQSYNDVVQRNKLLGAKIQYADKEDFSDCQTALNIDDVNIPDKLILNVNSPHRYWRYLAADGTNGSIAELAFFDSDTTMLIGVPICSSGEIDIANCAFDNNWLTNYETPWDKPDGAWVGLAFQKGVLPNFVRIVPRGDGNDIVPGDIYELKYFLEGKWVSAGKQIPNDNKLIYKNIPAHKLLWLSDLSTGREERPFLIEQNNEITWW